MLLYASTGPRSFGAQPIKPYRRFCWEFYAVIRGRIAPWLQDQKREPFQTNTLWLLPPTSIHGWRGEPKRHSQIVVFHFDGVPTALQTIVREGRTIQVPLDDGERQSLYRICKDVLPHLCTRTHLLEFHAQRALMELTLMFLKRSSETGRQEFCHSPKARVEAAEHWFRNNLSLCPTLGRLACETGTTVGHLRRIFRLVRHSSPKAVMNKIQVDHVARLLESTDLKLEVVAGVCGFKSVGSLCRVFKKLRAKTPGEHRDNPKLQKV